MRKVKCTELTPDTLVENIQARKAEIERILKERETALRFAPKGKIRIALRKRSLQYYYIVDPLDTKGVYLKREQDSFAAALAQKDYDYKLIGELKDEIEALDKVLDDYRPNRIDEIFASLHDYRKQLTRSVMLNDKYYIKRWKSAEYDKMAFDENAPDFYTANGEHVRSKSEILIADALSRHSIPYRYEYPIHIKGIGTVHPDFMCLNVRTRKTYLWEHSGMLSDPDYTDYAIKKIEKYMLAGYYPGANLILSFESANYPLSSRIIECNIKNYLLSMS